MRKISPSINIKPDKIEFVNTHLCHLEEVIYASKALLVVQSMRELSVIKGYAILTYGYIYFFTKKNKELQLEKRICLLNCDEIVLNREKSKSGKSSVSILTLPDLIYYTISDGKKIDVLYDYISYIIFIISNGVTSQISAPKLNPPIRKIFYPVPFAIYKRSLFFIHYDMKQHKIKQSLINGVSYFNDTTIYNKGELTIGQNFHPDNFTEYYGKAIGMESQIQNVKFQNFKEDLSELFGSISKNSANTLNFSFSNYDSAFPVFNFEKVVNSKIKSFEFTNSNFSIVDNFMTGCFNYHYNITNLKLANLVMHENDWINFFDSINNTRCFHSLTSFELFEMDFGHFPIDLFRDFLKLHSKLDSISISTVDYEGSILLIEILRECSNLRELHLNRINFENSLDIINTGASIVLPSNLILIDFSNSRFKNVSLRPILELLTSPISNREIKVNLMVNMSYLQPKENSFINAFKSLDLEMCSPTIFDLDWSGNQGSVDLFNFLSTQKELRFLTWNDITAEKPRTLFQYLSKLISESELIGVEIGCNNFSLESFDAFLSACKIARLQHFGFQCLLEMSEIGEKIANFISYLQSLKEVSINMSNLSKDMDTKIGNAILKSKSITACKLKSSNFDGKEQRKGEIKLIYNSIKSLKSPTNTEQRASYIRKCQNNFLVFDLATVIDAKEARFENEEEDNDE